MARNRIILALFAAVTILSGCGDQRVLERLGFIETQSFDLLPNGLLHIASSIPIADPDVKIGRKLLTTEAKSSKEAKIEFSRKTSLTLVSGQLRNILYGMSLAQRGLMEEFDTFGRDPAISPQVKISVVNGSAVSLLEKNFRQHPRTDKYIDRLLMKEAKEHSIPKVTLYEFFRDYFDDGIDPVAPVIKEEKENIVIDGIGLFKGAKYINKIQPQDSLVFGFLRGNFRHGSISVDLGGDEGRRESVMFNSLNSKRNVKVRKQGTRIEEVAVNVVVKGSVLEYIGPGRLDEEKVRIELENKISEHISGKANQMMKFMQKNEVDSVGIGKYVRNSMTYEQWKGMDWGQEFPNIRVKCNIRFKIKDSGRAA
ncbi:Ger(x)C family spore germination protein [Paenibacillus sp. MSJ-34]|uniref:Ger(x)C family spore germination protein n=1 Tax=Paenibacillus sp. MSJ-34 TaxID=2841529 RepID=UPI001C0FE2A7|nr:Ger(x)C family spore germination protein [Paenibacillus sp. MSJ-34]